MVESPAVASQDRLRESSNEVARQGTWIQDGAPHRLVTRQIRHGRTYLGDVPADGRVIEVLPLVEIDVVLHAVGVGAALLTRICPVSPTCPASALTGAH